jgi:hypothetical protein
MRVCCAAPRLAVEFLRPRPGRRPGSAAAPLRLEALPGLGLATMLQPVQRQGCFRAGSLGLAVVELAARSL